MVPVRFCRYLLQRQGDKSNLLLIFFSSKNFLILQGIHLDGGICAAFHGLFLNILRMKVNIQWLADGVDMPSLDFPRLEGWIGEVAHLHARIAGDITYIFCDDAKILEVNRQYLQHDYFTDIITFDYTRGRLIRGDLFISLDTVRSNAALVGVDYDTELHRVIIHGILHLCGIDDKGPGEREIMEHHENEALGLLLP